MHLWQCYFEVRICDSGTTGIIGIGLYPTGVPLVGMVGMYNGSIGYHADDGHRSPCLRPIFEIVPNVAATTAVFDDFAELDR